MSTIAQLFQEKSCVFSIECFPPKQTTKFADMQQTLRRMKELHPEMVGLGPFIPQHATPFADQKPGTLEETLFILALVRLMLPKVRLPATTALGTIHPEGRELGIVSGANVVMPYLSPSDVRKKYLLYDNKIATGAEAAEALDSLRERMKAIGCEIAVDRGDSPEL